MSITPPVTRPFRKSRVKNPLHLAGSKVEEVTFPIVPHINEEGVAQILKVWARPVISYHEEEERVTKKRTRRAKTQVTHFIAGASNSITTGGKIKITGKTNAVIGVPTKKRKKKSNRSERLIVALRPKARNELAVKAHVRP